MRIEFNPQALAAALKGNLAKKTTLPILAHVLLIAEGGSLRVVSTSLDMELEKTIDADVLEAGRVAVEAHRLAAGIQGLAGKACLSIDTTGGQSSKAILTHGRKRFTIPALPEADFPHLDGMDKAVTVDYSAAAIGKAIRRVQYAAGKTDVRRYLNGVHLCGRDVVATDGHRLSLVELEGDPAIPATIVPFAALKLLADALAMPGSVLVINDRMAEAVFDGGRFRTNVLLEPYPEYRRVVPRYESAPCAVIDPGHVSGALSRALPFANEKFLGATFTQTGEGLEITTRAPDSAEAADETPADIEGEWGEVSLCAQYLVDFIGQCSGAFRWFNPGSGSPQALIADENTIDVVMPMRM